MGAMRKRLSSSREKQFHDRLQRALLSVSFKHDGPTASPRPTEGDTTEDEDLSQEEVTQSETELDEKTHAGITRLPEMKDMRPRRTAIGAESQPSPSKDSSIVALNCVAELDKRVKSLQDSRDRQLDINQSMQRDLENALGRLAEMETVMSHEQRESDERGCRRTRRILRSER